MMSCETESRKRKNIGSMRFSGIAGYLPTLVLKSDVAYAAIPIPFCTAGDGELVSIVAYSSYIVLFF